jgi:hypothetical protein
MDRSAGPLESDEVSRYRRDSPLRESQAINAGATRFGQSIRLGSAETVSIWAA